MDDLNTNTTLHDNETPATDAPSATETTEQLAERIRKQEASKFRRTITQLEESSKSKEEIIKGLQKQLAESANKTRSALNIQAGQTELQESFNDRALPRVTDAAVIEEFKAERAARESLEREVKNLRKTLMVNDIMTQYEGRVIPEMITGDSPEEITSSALKAHNRYLEIEAAALRRANASLTTPAVTTPAVTTTPPTAAPTQAPRPISPTGSPGIADPSSATLESLASLNPMQRAKVMGAMSKEQLDALKQRAEAQFLST